MAELQESNQSDSIASDQVLRPTPARLRQSTGHPANSSASSLEISGQALSSSTVIAESTESGGSTAGEQGLSRIATVLATNKTYLAMPNLTGASLVGMLHLGDQIDKLMQESLDVGSSSERYSELIESMTEKLLRYSKDPVLNGRKGRGDIWYTTEHCLRVHTIPDQLRTSIHKIKKLPSPYWSDIVKIQTEASRALSDEDMRSKSINWLMTQDLNDWARLSIMTPTEHLVSRLPESKIGGWLCIPARLRLSNRKIPGRVEYSPRIRQFFSVAAEILFIILTWVFGSVPVIIQSLESPNKQLEIVFYSVFFVSWSITTSMLTSNFETRIYLNVGMAALYVQNIRAG